MAFSKTVKEVAEKKVWETLLYSYKMYNGKEENRCKGIKQSVATNEITFEHYKSCLFT